MISYNKKKLFPLLCLILVACFAVISAGCGSSSNSGGKKVAVSFANSSASWQKNGQTIKTSLEKEGYAVDLQFADSAAQQNEQLKAQIASNPNCIVIGAVDSEKLGDVLAEAKAKKIPVIAFDRLIMNTDAVSYYASFDSRFVGEAMGEYLEAVMNLKSGAGPFRMELFAGDPSDNNAHLFFSGAMDILKPYIDKGQLIVPSGETTFDQVATKDWKPETAGARMQKLLAGPDSGAPIDVILAPNDGVAGGIRDVLKAAGYTAMPRMSGQDAEPKALEAVKNGEQTFTIYKSPDLLVAKTVRMIKAVVDGTQPDINDTKTYNNGVITVPSYLCTPLIIDQGNLSEVK
ncbi:MAG: sugar-binding protein [Schwartzia sp.]|nr:sugar-binding protein [Schwartzia sp. (in: firmicutes)]